MTLEGIDALYPPSSAAIKAAGKSFVIRYTRAATVAQLADDRAEGLATVLVFETSGVDFTGGNGQGQLDAQLAQKQVSALGVPTAPVYFAIDAGTSLLQDVNDYLQGCCAVLGKPRVGVYGSYGVVEAASGGSWCAWFWQTYAWSQGHLSAAAHLYQYQNSVGLGGATVDLDRTVASDVNFGQIRWAAPDPPAEVDMRFGIFEATVLAGPYKGQTGQFVSDGTVCRWIPPDYKDAAGNTISPLADITGSTGPWFNNGLPVETWPGGPVADLGAFAGVAADAVTAEMLGLPCLAPPSTATGLSAAQAQQLADLSAAVARIEAALKGA